MKKILAIDVDLTVVDSLSFWKNWYTKITGHDLGEVSSENNDVETFMKYHDDPLEFWRKADLYDDMMPLTEATKYVKKLKELGLEIIFVSSCYPEHERSKRFFLQRNFPYMDGFISTSDKNYVKCDYFVDDYEKYCRQMLGKAMVFQIKTELNSPSKGEFPYVEWWEIYEYIREDFFTGKIK